MFWHSLRFSSLKCGILLSVKKALQKIKNMQNFDAHN